MPLTPIGGSDDNHIKPDKKSTHSCRRSPRAGLAGAAAAVRPGLAWARNRAAAMAQTALPAGRLGRRVASELLDADCGEWPSALDQSPGRIRVVLDLARLAWALAGRLGRGRPPRCSGVLEEKPAGASPTSPTPPRRFRRRRS